MILMLFLPRSEDVLEVLGTASSAPSAIWPGSTYSVRSLPLQLYFHAGEEEEVTG